MKTLSPRRALTGGFGTALLLATAVSTWAQTAPKQGEWDGKTASAKLEGPYEDPYQTPPDFGAISYFSQPWRGYMDTWPATIWANGLGVSVTGDDKYVEATAQLLREAGIRFVRVEIGWGNLNWDDQVRPEIIERITRNFNLYKKYGIRPMILLNSHHGVPAPLRDLHVPLLQDAAKGDRVLKLAAGTQVKVGYTGCVNLADYKAAYPLITAVAEDGTAQLSAPLPAALKAGNLHLMELKYQPFQGTQLKDGTPVPAALETFEGWKKYALAVGNLARSILGTPTDSGFDIEVWNEQTFGSDYLGIHNYYDPKPEFAQPLTYKKTRIWTTKMRPDARLEFEQKGYEAILPLTIDFFNDPANDFHNVRVNSGFSNQWPWNSGSSLWDGQNGLNKHYYTGTDKKKVSPETPFDGKDHGTFDAFGKFDGVREGNEWWKIVPGTNFVPTLSITFPEWAFSAFKTETLQRDLFPDSRRTHTPDYMGHYGRYTHNGDFRTPKYWQTEVNYDRSAFNQEVMEQSGVKPDDPRLKLLNDATNSKHLLRQAVFQLHKGIERLFFFSTDFGYSEIGLFPPQFFRELDKSEGKLTPAARAALPQWPSAFASITRLLAEGGALQAPRQLRVDELVEHKPRLVFAGDGTPAHPSRYNRDFFAFMPLQLSTKKFAIPYYVVTPDATHVWNEKLDVLDPARYDMPPQDFDVTIGNLNGIGAKISAFDPLTGKTLPIQTLKATASTLALRLPATDAPRMLVIEEAKDGIQITNAKIEAPKAGEAVLSWILNRPAGAVRVSYGGDWPQRGANEITIATKPGQTAYRVVLPVQGAEMVAARIRVAADGISAVWPRWDEDPQGQVTMPDAKPRPRGEAPPRPQVVAAPAKPLMAPQGIALPLDETNPVRGYNLKLPANSVVSGAPDDRTVVIGTGANAITMRLRYVEGAAKNGVDYLPYQSATDKIENQKLTLPNGKEALLSDYTLAPTAYPGVSDTRRRYLQIVIDNDLLMISATGTPATIQAQNASIEAVFASFTTTPTTK